MARRGRRLGRLGAKNERSQCGSAASNCLVAELVRPMIHSSAPTRPPSKAPRRLCPMPRSAKCRSASWHMVKSKDAKHECSHLRDDLTVLGEGCLRALDAINKHCRLVGGAPLSPPFAKVRLTGHGRYFGVPKRTRDGEHLFYMCGRGTDGCEKSKQTLGQRGRTEPRRDSTATFPIEHPAIQ
jgi:hypothetical protein